MSILRSLPRPVWILLGAVLVNRIGLVVMPMMSMVLRERGWPQDWAIWSGSAYAIGATLSAVPAGLAADRLGRRSLLVVSMGLTAVLFFVLSVLDAVPAMLIGILCLGMVAEAHRPAVSAMLTDLVPVERRIPVFALHRTVTNLGHAIGPMLGGLLAAAAMFQWLFYLDGVTAACFALLAALFLPETRPKGPRTPLSLRGVLSDRAFLWFCLGLLPVSAGYFQLLAGALPIHLKDHLGAVDGVLPALGFHGWILGHLPFRDLLARPEGTFGLLMGMNALLIVCCEYPLSLRLRHVDPRRSLMAGALLTAGGLFLIGQWPTADGALAGIVLATLGEMCFAPTALYVVTRLAPPDRRAQYLALFGITHGSALILAPALSGALLPRVGPAWTWALVALCTALSVPAFRALPDRVARTEPLHDPGS